MSKARKAMVDCAGERVEVRVMAVADGYAMVRKSGRIPFVVSERDLEFVEQEPKPKKAREPKPSPDLVNALNTIMSLGDKAAPHKKGEGREEL